MGTSKPRHQLFRRAGEVAAVFLGVALAFVADNFREDLQEQAAANDLASALLEDLNLSLVDLREAQAAAQAKTHASLEAREHLRSSVPTVGLDSLSHLLARSGGTNLQAPVLRSYDQLVATGLLRRLDPEVRRALADWVTAMELSRDYFERDLLDFRQSVAFPFWAESVVSFEQMLQGYALLEGLELGEPRFPHSWRELHQSRELNDLLVEFAAISFSVERSYVVQEAALVSLIQLLDGPNP